MGIALEAAFSLRNANCSLLLNRPTALNSTEQCNLALASALVLAPVGGVGSSVLVINQNYSRICTQEAGHRIWLTVHYQRAKWDLCACPGKHPEDRNR